MFFKVFASDYEFPIEVFSARLVLKADAKFVKHKAYRVPFALDDIVSSLLDGWSNPKKRAFTGFPVSKKDGTYRVVADFKKTLNPHPALKISRFFTRSLKIYRDLFIS